MFPSAPLSGEETSQLLLARLGTKSLPVSLQAKLLEASGGNPLFAEELVRLVEDRDLLVRRGGSVTLREGVELPTPDSIGSLIAARLDLLSAERKALISDAAVVGRSFWAGAVAVVGPHELSDVLAGFYDLVAKELVRPERSSSIEGETEFAFVHALVCDVSYSQLTLADRAAKHARLARWLEERTAGRTEDLAEVLAFHYGTAREMAHAAGLFELEDELTEPTSALPRTRRRPGGAPRRERRRGPLRPRRAGRRRGARSRSGASSSAAAPGAPSSAGRRCSWRRSP